MFFENAPLWLHVLQFSMLAVGGLLVVVGSGLPGRVLRWLGRRRQATAQRLRQEQAEERALAGVRLAGAEVQELPEHLQAMPDPALIKQRSGDLESAQPAPEVPEPVDGDSTGAAQPDPDQHQRFADFQARLTAVAADRERQQLSPQGGLDRLTEVAREAMSDLQQRLLERFEERQQALEQRLEERATEALRQPPTHLPTERLAARRLRPEPVPEAVERTQPIPAPGRPPESAPKVESEEAEQADVATEPMRRSGLLTTQPLAPLASGGQRAGGEPSGSSPETPLAATLRELLVLREQLAQGSGEAARLEPELAYAAGFLSDLSRLADELRLVGPFVAAGQPVPEEIRRRWDRLADELAVRLLEAPQRAAAEEPA